LPQADGVKKDGPVLIIGPTRPFGDLLVAGISTQLLSAVPDFDEVVDDTSSDFAASGSSVRYSDWLFVAGVPPRHQGCHRLY